MNTRAIRGLGWGLLAVIAIGCGKKSPPLPPLRPVPSRIADLSAVRTEDRIELRFTVPDSNLDGSTPVVIDRVDIFMRAGESGEPPPPAGQIAANAGNLRRSLPVRRPPPDGVATPETPVSLVIPAPGEMAVFVDHIGEADLGDASALYYVAVPVAGTGRGRPGPPTPIANVPLGPLPQPPTNLMLTHDESQVRGTWQPSGDGQAFHVYRAAADAGDQRLTPEPLTSGEVSFPVEFGRETCIRVQAVEVTGSVVVQGPMSTPVCLTPVDAYPPPAPASLRVVQEGAGITIMWEAVAASDLAGYVVLRGEGDDGSLSPLFQQPIQETTYRDADVQVGMTYRYAVYALDAAPTPNISALSPRETIIVR